MLVQKLINAIVELDEKQATELTKKALDENFDPLKLLDAISTASEIIGEKYERGEYFVADLVMAGEILKEVTGLIKPTLANVKQKSIGRVVVGTVEGDIHDIGKNIVVTMLESAGFEVIDLGVDVPAQTFIEAIKNYQPSIVGMSGLLTVAIESMKKIVDAIKDAGLRDKIKIIIGGGRVNENVMQYVGADAWANNAAAGVKICKQLLSKNR